ncbi:MAG: hypothetical protein JXJ04_09715 [Spirochaetales bacterium]|nr:hypothetical protein [Spirochaetales bacterium]
MKENKTNPGVQAKEKLLRFLKSKAYPVIPVRESTGTSVMEPKNTKETFIDQLKKSIKDPCIFVHFPEDDSSSEM